MLSPDTDLLYRDALMLVINKPSGLPVHAGSKGGATVESYLDAFRFGLPQPPRLAHRLDRDTAGCLILGRQAKGLRRLGLLFQHGGIDKTYWAVVHGQPPAAQGRINAPLAKQTQDKRRWWMKVSEEGQPSITDYEVLGHADGYSFVAFMPRTGRTHQIRVHAAHIGCPLVGDAAYGVEGDGQPLHLLARQVVIPLYPQKPPITVEAPLPRTMPLFSRFSLIS
jgi:RluA family pseudouridine synthase